jgi:hypothetical protein
MNYIYIIQLREFIGKDIYKIGRTKQENNKRMGQYTKGSILHLQTTCNDCIKSEKNLIKLFKEKYIHRNDLGNEYFEGNINHMKADIFSEILLCSDSDSNIDYSEEIDSDDVECYDDEFIEEQLKHIKKEIKKIVITNKETQEGYFQFSKSGQWRILEDKENNGSSTIETLHDLIEEHSNHYCHNNNCDVIDRLTDFIANKNYSRNPSIYKLQYHEHIIHAHHDDNNNVHYYLFNAYQKTFMHLTNINKIIIDSNNCRNSSLYWIKEFQSIDTRSVNTILTKLMKYETILGDYKVFCKSVILGDENQYIFYDNSNHNKLLTSWLTDIMNTLGIKYYEFYEKEVKINKEDLVDVRLVIIYSDYSMGFKNNSLYYGTRTEKEIDKIIKKIYKCGVNKIIIKSTINSKESLYDYKSYLDYIYENEQEIKSFCHSDDLGLRSKEYEYKSCNYDDILMSTRLLHTHFLKYIVS